MKSVIEHAMSRLGGVNTPQECYEQIGSDISIRVQFVDNPDIGINYYKQGEEFVEAVTPYPTLVFVLGAEDPEMIAIEQLLRNCGIPFVFAKVSGQRVNSENAYQADAQELPYTWDIVLVECDFDSGSFDPLCLCDHHRDGDSGFDMPPEYFMSSSSLGQVISILAQDNLIPSGGGWISLKENVEQGAIIYKENTPFSGWRVGQETSTLLIPWDYACVAAVDHCSAAAYEGKCPGVRLNGT